jgi:DNA-binding CsgD family transcriptional regulator
LIKRRTGERAARSPAVTVAVQIDEPLLASRIAAVLADRIDFRIDDLDPDVVVTDVLPDGGGSCPLVLISDQPDIIAALHGGAAGVLPTTATAEQVRATIEAVAQGLSVMPREAIADEIGASEDDTRVASAAPLTPRELEVLNLMAAGASNKVIARNLDISIHTAKFHVASILAKLDATGRTDAVAQAARLGLLML